MTPFGARIRSLRAERGVSQREMAATIGVSAAYLSALEHGRRGRPPWTMVQKIIGYFNVIWDDAEELVRLAELSDPRVRIDTSGLSRAATDFANRLALHIRDLDETGIRELDAALGRSLDHPRQAPTLSASVEPVKASDAAPRGGR